MTQTKNDQLNHTNSRKWKFLIFFGSINLLGAMTLSLQAPFYPQEAESKGATATEYGFVFGVFELIVFILSPVVGKYINAIGPKNVFFGSIFIAAIALVCFGLLHFIQERWTFITLSVICRVFEALGYAAYINATFVIIACEFPDSVATTFGSLETMIGLGVIIGPTFGGGLFQLGGFPLPFLVVGGLLLILSLLAAVFMPKTTQTAAQSTPVFGPLTILKIPPIFLVSLSIVTVNIGIGFVASTLEPHIRQFQLSPVALGAIFIISGTVYSLAAPVLGYICDKVTRPIFVTFFGNVLMFTSALLVGPAGFIPVDTVLWLTILGLVIKGFAEGCCFVSSFMVGIQEATKHGLPDDINTYAVVSGLFQALMSLGGMIGLSGGGALYDAVGFRDGLWLVLGSSAISAGAILVFLAVPNQRNSADEAKPLLSKT